MLLSTVIWLSIPMLGGIVDKASQVRHEHLPELTRWRYNTQRIEQIYGFIETIYWTHDHNTARSSRLQAQVLIDSFAFGSNDKMAQRAKQLMGSIQMLGILRDERRSIIETMHQSANQLLNAAHQSQIPQRYALGELASSTLRINVMGTNWRELRLEAQSLLGEIPPSIASEAENTRFIAFIRQLQNYFSNLENADQHIHVVYQQALQQQRELASQLSSDTALKTQLIATSVEEEARQVRFYSILILLLIGCIALCLPWLFQRFLVRPIMQCSQALQQISSGAKVDYPERTALQELDTICQSVCQYGEMTYQLQEANQELLYLARHDGLTGLSNRRHFDNVLENELARSRRNQSDLVLVLLDIDHFKKLNDRYGHPFGDECLRQMANILRNFSRRPGDLAARYGGEEFALILPDITLEQGKQLTERLRQSVEALITHNEENLPVQFTMSAGLVHIFDMPQYKPKDLVHMADLALYRAKQLGRNRVEVATIDDSAKL